MRSALLDVKGVSRAVVDLERHEAIVTFDPRQTTVQALIGAVNQAKGPADFITYSASVKQPPPHPIHRAMANRTDLFMSVHQSLCSLGGCRYSRVERYNYRAKAR